MAASDRALFDRRCRVTVANPSTDTTNFSDKSTDVIQIDGGTTDQTDVPGLRVAFSIAKTDKKEPNTSQITVTNLSDSRRKSLQKVGVKILLEAGYKELGVTKFFSGDVRTIDHVRNGADWDTTFKLGDGERAWKYARVNESFAAGTRAADALTTIAKKVGLQVGNLSQQANLVNAIFDQGWAACGSASRAFDQIVRSIGKTWSIQDDTLQILDPFGTVDLPVPVISVDSGLIGSPEMGTPPAKGKPAMLKFTSLLIPVKPGAKVKLESERYNGYIRIHKVNFIGDTAGGDWFSHMEGTISQ